MGLKAGITMSLSISHPVDAARIQSLNANRLQDGEFVLYWMQQSQRAQDNHALEYAAALANHCGLPLLAVFGLTFAYPEANRRHYTFMLEGLRETRADLARRGVRLALVKGHPPEVALEVGRKAAAVVCDRGYLRHQRIWRQEVAAEAHCPVIQVESDALVPVDVVSTRAEYAARTIRPKIRRHLEGFLRPVKTVKLRQAGPVPALKKEIGLEKVDGLLASAPIDQSVAPAARFFRGGAREARKRLKRFTDQRLRHYSANGNQPQTDDVSHMSPYLHFGQISPVRIALQVSALRGTPQLDGEIDAYMEQLIVRRELAINFVLHTPDYDRYTCIPAWAKKTLEAHLRDKREYLYGRKALENGQTHDHYWNAAMLEMRHTGFMHNYMRMYWGKKILEWSRTPEAAFETTLALNNRYFIDGRDPNSYAGVAWLFGVHDRAWQERPVFGKIRYMAASGLERKCDIGAYVEKVRKRIP
jgi:deoxyribodipyrimidine photo-lyase